MRVLFMGTPYFAIPSLEALLKAGYGIVTVVTQPDRPKGRSLKPTPPPLKEFALRHGIPVFQPETLRSDEVRREISLLKPDIIVVVAYGEIIPNWLIELPRYGCVNVHASLLPRYRGAAPIQRAILDGCTMTGITTMLMDQGLDTGDILLQSAIPISPDDTSGSLEDKLSKLGAELLLSTIEGLSKGAITPIKQNHKNATYAPKIEKDEMIIDWALPADGIRNLIRALNPSPGAFTFYKGKRLKIWWAEVMPDAKFQISIREPGMIIDVDANKGFIVACGRGQLLMVEVQPEGRRRMIAAEFCRGYRVEAGEKLERRIA